MTARGANRGGTDSADEQRDGQRGDAQRSGRAEMGEPDGSLIAPQHHSGVAPAQNWADTSADSGTNEGRTEERIDRGMDRRAANEKVRSGQRNR